MSVHLQIEERAADWLMRRESPDWSDADQRALDSWLDESMAHKAAFWRLEHGWRQADRLGSLGEAVAPRPAPFPVALVERAWRPMALAASVALLLMLGTPALPPIAPPPPAPPRQTVETRVGGHRIIPLEDGSRIELNTATVLRTAVTTERREIWLDRGEAYFEVRHSDKVPFRVYAGPRTVTVLGTKFSVRRDGDRVSVSVVEGRVRVDEAGRAAEVGGSTTVTTGDVAITEGHSTLVAAKSPERVENALAWRNGMLTFDQVTLGEAAAEFNRYNARQIVITDPQVASIRIGGTFRASSVDAFVRLLHDAYGLDARVSGNSVKLDS